MPTRSSAATVRGSRRSTTRSIRAFGLVAGALALLSMLAGCGDGDVLRAGASADPVAATATPAFLAESAERTVALQTGSIEAQLSGPQVDATVTGSFDTAARAAAFTIEAAFDEQGPADAPSVGAVSAHVVVADGAVYVRPGGVAAALAEAMGAPWLAAEVGEPASAVPEVLEVLAVDPAELLERLESGGITVAEVGPEPVRDVPATHYRAETPADPELHVPAATFDVWIDDAGLVRRIAVTGDGYTAQVELFDLGEPVSIEVPAPSSVTDLGGLDDLVALLENLPR